LRAAPGSFDQPRRDALDGEAAVQLRDRAAMAQRAELAKAG
jgi:hypothetical protein